MSRLRINDRLVAFWARVNKTEGCWLWTGRVGASGGYGKFDVCGIPRSAHRHAWELMRGAVPDGRFVCHDCPGGDNPLCVRPDHMFLGTQADNIADMWKKGRGVRGVAHGMARLSESDVIDIRTLKALGACIPDMAEAFGVHCETVRMVTDRKNWRHLP